MLVTSCFIDSPTSAGDDKYTLDLYFSPATKAKFTRLGDVLTDKNSNEYEVVTPTVLPLSDGDTITVQAIEDNVLPQQDSNYDSTIETSNQIDSTPSIRTGGALNSAVLVSGPLYTYRVFASWDSSSEANASDVGDSIVDSNGKDFRIVSFDNPAVKWGDTVVIEEFEKEGDSPAIGAASLFRPTSNYGFYQGAPINDPARTVAYNRDSFYQDLKLKDLESNSGGTGSSIEFELENDSGTVLTTLTPVCSVNGTLEAVDVNNENKVLAMVGFTKSSIAHGVSGIIVEEGLIEDVVLTDPVDTILYVSKTGELTSTKPDIGVNGFIAGDFVIIAGKILKNQQNPSKKDFLVKWSLVGQL